MDIEPLILKLQSALKKVADPKVRDWFNAYLKGACDYRGVKTPQVITIVKKWWGESDLDALPEGVQFNMALTLLREHYAEDTFAGIIIIERYLLRKVSPAVQLRAYKKLFAGGYFRDWSTTDWFCVRVLDPLIGHNGLAFGREVAKWSTAKNLWQRRASVVSLRGVAHDLRFLPLIKETVTRLVVEDERFIQTGIGWLLAELSRAHPGEAEKIFRRHLSDLSREVIDRHSKHLKCHRELKALKRNGQRKTVRP